MTGDMIFPAECESSLTTVYADKRVIIAQLTGRETLGELARYIAADAQSCGTAPVYIRVRLAAVRPSGHAMH